MRIPQWLSGVVALAALLPCAQAQLLVNGSFEVPAAREGGLFPTSVLPGWTVDGNVDVVHTGYWQAADGSQSIDLSGETASPGTFIEQTFLTTAGQFYLLSFYYANNAETPFTSGNVSLRGNVMLLSLDLFHSGSTHQNMGYILFRRGFRADASSTVLRFTHLSSPNPLDRGLALDGVAITPVPEPATLALFAFCGVVLVGYAKRINVKCWSPPR